MIRKIHFILFILLVFSFIFSGSIMAQSKPESITTTKPDSKENKEKKKDDKSKKEKEKVKKEKVKKEKVKKEKKEKLSDADKAKAKLISAGDKIFNSDVKRYDKALVFYLKAKNMGAKTEKLYYNIGYSYFKLKEYKKSEKYFFKLVHKDSLRLKKSLYYYARLQHLNYQFDSAITYFGEYRRTLSPDDLAKMDKDIQKKLKECNFAKEMVATPVLAFVDSLGDNINSKYVDYAPLISADDSTLIFTTRRPNENKSNRDQDGAFFEEIYISKKDSSGNWVKASSIGKPISGSGHSACAGLSADGNSLIVYKSSGNGDLYLSKKQKGKWTSPKSLGKNINSSEHESSASFSYDNLKLYISSDREGGYGGQDIYVSLIDEKGNWGKAQNMMRKINTAYDETSFIALPDGETFYFTSSGHNSMGGLDIFKITYKDSAWSDAVNLGYPINTPNDDVINSISNDGKRAYFASMLDEANKHDIFMLTFMNEVKQVFDDLDGLDIAVYKYGELLPPFEKAVNIQKLNLTVLKGIITDKNTKEPIYASIELTDNSTNKVVATFNSNEQTGSYLVSLPAGKNYGIAVKAENCLFYSDNVKIGKVKGYKEIVKDIQLQRISVGSKVILKNIFFASGKAKLTKSSETELQNLLKLMNDIPKLKIEVSGHTDNVGRASSNKALSKRRAKAVVDFLVKNGVAIDRMVYKGYGFEQPIASNKTKEGRQQNRRTEFKVIAK
ncbi:MAG: hypothetical protein DRI86_03505 [Bacteroidetes bacterium]|nr:MAG: hypothetical protein DRI86_03505 [Bacteroidota bacterium]